VVSLSESGHLAAFLVADVGNSRIGLAVATNQGLRGTQRVATNDSGDWDDVLAAVWDAARAIDVAPLLVIASVVPDAAEPFAARAVEQLGVRALFVRDDIPLPLPLDLDNEDEVGVDRVCSAAAAHQRFGGACAIASFGTAITVDFVTAEGRFLGGTILPGLDMACEALHVGTAALPRIEPGPPTGPFGRNTHDAINSGVVYGAIGAMREIVERFATERSGWPTLVITGGNAELIHSNADFVDAIVPDLCLMGVALAYQRSQGRK
jgi:type III pantothenate kinase